jgi:gluconokinase
MTKGMMYFPRMLDKIRLHGRGELSEEYHANMGAPRTADAACTNFLRVNYGVLRQRVLKGGTDEEILDWCYTNGRRLNEGDLLVWNGFVSKLGLNDFASPVLDEAKQKCGAGDRADLNTIVDFIDFDEKRRD